MIKEIKLEVSEAVFVALVLDEATDISMNAQISSVLRYVTKNGDVEERFLHFITDISQHRTANAFFQHAKQVLFVFNCASKLVAQTYDGAAVMASEHAGLQAKLKEHCKDAVFVHCYAHILNLVLSQSVSFIKQVKILFTSLSGFGTFFFQNRRRGLQLWTLR
jgi:small basic protein